MTAPVPVPDGTTPPAEAVEAVGAVMDALGCSRGNMGGQPWCEVHSVDWHPEGCGDALAAIDAVVAALNLPERDRETAAKALDEAAEAFQAADHATRFILQPAKWLRARASALREGRDGRG